MLDIQTIISATFVCAAGVMSPGPNFVAVTHRAMIGARLENIVFVFGITLVNLIWATLSILGLGAIIAKVPSLFWIIKMAGAGYLIWYGISLLLKANKPISFNTSGKATANYFLALRKGIINNISNPKSAIFYASIFSSTLPREVSIQTSLGLIAMVGMVTIFWYGGVALLFSGKKIANIYRAMKTWIDRICGIALICFGGKQAV